LRHALASLEQRLEQEGAFGARLGGRQDGRVARLGLFRNPLEGAAQKEQANDGADCDDKDNAAKENAVPLRCGHVGQTKGLQNVVEGAKFLRHFAKGQLELFQVACGGVVGVWHTEYKNSIDCLLALYVVVMVWCGQHGLSSDFFLLTFDGAPHRSSSSCCAFSFLVGRKSNAHAKILLIWRREQTRKCRGT